MLSDKAKSNDLVLEPLVALRRDKSITTEGHNILVGAGASLVKIDRCKYGNVVPHYSSTQLDRLPFRGCGEGQGI